MMKGSPVTLVLMIRPLSVSIVVGDWVVKLKWKF